ncbi:MAG: toxin HicA [Chloroflexi bacterium]|nr:toxin HicA [Chloroflexota bacterium]
MSKKEKALAKLRQNPKHVRFEEIERVLLRLGFKKRQDGTSHAVFTLGKHIINVPKRKPFVPNRQYIADILPTAKS